MSTTVTIHIDGVPYAVPDGMNLVDAARIYAGVEIPSSVTIPR
jgi:NADH dehydrogenase/NADH:ubiquinone oxidoreductase subunit G